MKRFKINIEETINQDFVVEANSEQEALLMAKEKYKTGGFILDDALLTSKKLALISADHGAEIWEEF